MKGYSIKPVDFILGLMGIFAATYGVLSAIFYASYYWYSFFVVGLFLWWDRLDAAVNRDSNLNRLFSASWRTPVYTYLTYLAAALFIDLLMGGYIGNLWIYPHFSLSDKLVNVFLVGYPFALFSCAAFYRVLRGWLRQAAGLRSPANGSPSEPPTIIMIFLLLTIFSVFLPIAYLSVVGKGGVQAVIIIAAVIGMFSLAPVAGMYGRDSLMGGICSRDRPTIIALLISIPVNALAHELPNTFAWEWRYQNMPFTSMEVLGVPIIVLMVGWAYLTILGISGNELFFSPDHPPEGDRATR